MEIHLFFILKGSSLFNSGDLSLAQPFLQTILRVRPSWAEAFQGWLGETWTQSSAHRHLQRVTHPTTPEPPPYHCHSVTLTVTPSAVSPLPFTWDAQAQNEGRGPHIALPAAHCRAAGLLPHGPPSWCWCRGLGGWATSAQAKYRHVPTARGTWGL